MFSKDRIMRQAFIFGANDFSELVLSHLKNNRDAPEIVAFVVDRQFLHSESYSGLPLAAFDEAISLFPPESFGAYVCVGYKRMNKGRQAAYQKLLENGYNILSYIHPAASVECERKGLGTIALANVTVDRHCQIGNGNIFQIGAMVAHHSKIGDFNFFAPGACVTGQVDIGDNCFFGANSTIKNGIKISDATLVGAGAYVAADTEADSVILPPRSVSLERRSLEIL